MTTNTNKYWTSCWSPLRSRWELRTSFAIVLNEFASCVYVMFSRTSTTRKKNVLVKNGPLGKQTGCSYQNTAPAASLFSHKKDLGVPIHIKCPTMFIDIYYYDPIGIRGSIRLSLLLIPPWAE